MVRAHDEADTIVPPMCMLRDAQRCPAAYHQRRDQTISRSSKCRLCMSVGCTVALRDALPELCIEPLSDQSSDMIASMHTAEHVIQLGAKYDVVWRDKVSDI